MTKTPSKPRKCTSIAITPVTLEKLRKHKIHHRETDDECVSRLVDEFETLKGLNNITHPVPQFGIFDALPCDASPVKHLFPSEPKPDEPIQLSVVPEENDPLSFN